MQTFSHRKHSFVKSGHGEKTYWTFHLNARTSSVIFCWMLWAPDLMMSFLSLLLTIELSACYLAIHLSILAIFLSLTLAVLLINSLIKT